MMQYIIYTEKKIGKKKKEKKEKAFLPYEGL